MSNHTAADHHQHEEHSHSIYQELACHFPYAIFSVAFSLVILSFVSYFSTPFSDASCAAQGAHTLFHSFHFMHIAFAATGTLITFSRFSKNLVKGVLVGILSSSFFCVLSDAVIPYLGGRLLGVDMHFHICFVSEVSNVLPFLVTGIINGIIMGSHHHSKQGFYSLTSHAVHILISSLASAFYLISHGFTDWQAQIGPVFLFLIVAVLVPCTLSDLVVPMAFARSGNHK